MRPAHRLLRLLVILLSLALPSCNGGTSTPARLDLYHDPLPEGAVARLGTVRLRHGEYVHCAVFSRDGKVLITGGADGVIRLWEVPTGKPLRQLEGHQGWVRCLALSPDGKTLASGGGWWDFSLRLWDVGTGKKLRCLDKKEHGEIGFVAFSPDGKALYSARDREISVWDARTGRRVRSFNPLQLTGNSSSVALSPDGRTIAAVTDDADRAQRFPVAKLTVRLLDTGTGAELRKLPVPEAGGLGRISFSPDGRLCAVQARSHIQVMTADLAKEVTRAPAPKNAGDFVFTFSPDGRTLATAARNGSRPPHKIHLWDLGSGKERLQLPGHNAFVEALAFSPDGKTLASGSSDASVRLWDAVSGKEITQTAGHHGWVWGVAFSPDGKKIATAASDHTVRLWDAVTGKALQELRGHRQEVWAVRFSPDGATLASGSWDGSVRLWEVETGKELHTLTGFEGEVRALAFSPDGKLLAAAGRGADQHVHLWDLPSGREAGRLSLGRATQIFSLAFSPDGKYLASGEKEILLWDVARKRPVPWFHPTVCDPQSNDTVKSLAFSPDGRTIFSAGDKVQLWETITGKERWKIAPPANRCLSAAAFSPDGRRIMTVYHAGGVRVADGTQVLHFWDVPTATKIGRRTGHSGLIGCAAWGPDGKLLVTGSDDTSALVWETSFLKAR
jgi:WD40 repeat protein